MSTRVVNLRRSSYDVYIGRAGHGQEGTFGNPFPVNSKNDRSTVLEKYKSYFLDRVESDPEFRKKVLALKDKILG